MEVKTDNPKFISRKRFNLDSKIEVKYPEKTWSIEQSYRDIYQNHLDAQVKRGVNELLIDVATQLKVTADEIIGNHQLRLAAYEFLMTRDVIPQAEQNIIIDYIIQETLRIYGLSGEDTDKAAAAAQSHRVELPKVEILIRNFEGNEIWMDARKFGSPESSSESTLGWRISDQGDGYDATLKAILYSSDKETPDQIGKFGEGGKLSEILLQQRGFWIESRSAHKFTDDSGEHYLLWKSRPYKNPEGSLELHVTRVEPAVPIASGSATEVRFNTDSANKADIKRFLSCIDNQRFPEILFEADQSFQQRFRYLPFEPGRPMMGISVVGNELYVQGLKVEAVNTGVKPLFTYNTFDKGALDARDRNKYSDEFAESIEEAWLKADVTMVRAYFDRIDDGPPADGGKTLEMIALNRVVFDSLLDERTEGIDDAILKTRECVAQVIEEVFNLRSRRQIYFKNGTEKNNFLDDLENAGIFIVDLGKYGLHPHDDFYRTYFGKRFISSSEAISKFRSARERDPYRNFDRAEKKREEAWFNEVFVLVTDLAKKYGISETFDPPTVAFRNLGAIVTEEALYESDDFLDDRSRLVINWEEVKKSDDQEQIKRLVAVYIFAQRYDTFLLPNAQQTAETVLKNGWASVAGKELEDIDYKGDPSYFIKMFERLRMTETERRVMEFDFLTALSKERVDEELLEDVIKYLNSVLIKDHQFELMISSSIFRSGQDLVRFEFANGKYNLTRVTLPEAQTSGYFRFGDQVIIPLPKFDYLKFGDWTVYEFEGTLYRSSPSLAIAWETEMINSPLRLGDGYLYFKVNDQWDNQRIRDEVDDVLGDLKLVDKNAAMEYKETKLEAGHVLTSVSLKYGEQNWDNPVRFFEDVVQNHLNAGNVEVRYLVRRAADEIWVEEKSIGRGDQIIGIEFDDDGSGYAPESLERMGKTEKDSPLDLGKYGEGTKMLMAAASRNQIELEFESTCWMAGEKVRWTAKAEPGQIKVIERGTRGSVNMAGFDLKYSNEHKVGSVTRVRFPDTSSKFYEACLAVVDPRSNGGLKKYARSLPGGAEVLCQAGPVKVIKNSEGNVFENGLFVKRLNLLVGGVDVPDICVTRERNEISEKKFQQYIDFLISHTTDKGLIQKLVNALADSTTFYHDDTRHIFKGPASDFPNIGLWREVVDEYYPSVIADDIGIRDMDKSLLQYNGYTKTIVASLTGVDSTGKIKQIFPTLSELVRRNRMEVFEPPADVVSTVIKVVDILADELLMIIDSGRLTEATNAEFIEILRDKDRLHQSIKYSRIHPYILGQANMIESTTTISEGLLEDADELIVTILHEWAHHLSKEGDLKPKFIATLLGIGWGHSIEPEVDALHVAREEASFADIM